MRPEWDLNPHLLSVLCTVPLQASDAPYLSLCYFLWLPELPVASPWQTDTPHLRDRLGEGVLVSTVSDVMMDPSILLEQTPLSSSVCRSRKSPPFDFPTILAQ